MFLKVISNRPYSPIQAYFKLLIGIDKSSDKRHVKEAERYFCNKDNNILANQRAYALNQMFVLQLAGIISSDKSVKISKEIKKIFNVDWKRFGYEDWE